MINNYFGCWYFSCSVNNNRSWCWKAENNNSILFFSVFFFLKIWHVNKSRFESIFNEKQHFDIGILYTIRHHGAKWWCFCHIGTSSIFHPECQVLWIIENFFFFVTLSPSVRIDNGEEWNLWFCFKSIGNLCKAYWNQMLRSHWYIYQKKREKKLLQWCNPVGMEIRSSVICEEAQS